MPPVNATQSASSGKPSELAQRVTDAFRSAAADAVAVNRARGNTVVGEVDGEWRAEKKKATSS